MSITKVTYVDLRIFIKQLYITQKRGKKIIIIIFKKIIHKFTDRK